MVTPRKFDWCPTLSGVPPDRIAEGIDVRRVMIPVHNTHAQDGQFCCFFHS
jgi:hypothetical protein